MAALIIVDAANVPATADATLIAPDTFVFSGLEAYASMSWKLLGDVYKYYAPLSDVDVQILMSALASARIDYIIVS